MSAGSASSLSPQETILTSVVTGTKMTVTNNQFLCNRKTVNEFKEFCQELPIICDDNKTCIPK